MSDKPPYRPDGESPWSDADGEPEPTAEEIARAASLARLVDRMTEGGAPPPAMPADERLLIDAAAMIHTAHRPRPLHPKHVNEIVAAVLAEPAATPRRVSRMIPFPAPGARAREAASAGDGGQASVSGLDLRPRSLRIKAAVGGVALAVAAALAIWFWSGRVGKNAASMVTASALPQRMVSRSAGSLLGGPIASAESGDARSRMDLLFADRLSGYREVVFRGQSKRGIASGGQQ